jgi:hypothetical protein
VSATVALVSSVAMASSPPTAAMAVRMMTTMMPPQQKQTPRPNHHQHHQHHHYYHSHATTTTTTSTSTTKKRFSSRSWTLLAHHNDRPSLLHDDDGRGTSLLSSASTPLFLQVTVKHMREERRVPSGAGAHMYYYVLVKTDTTYDIEVLMPGPMRQYNNRPAFGEQQEVVSGAWLVEELRWMGVLAAAF